METDWESAMEVPDGQDVEAMKPMKPVPERGAPARLRRSLGSGCHGLLECVPSRTMNDSLFACTIGNNFSLSWVSETGLHQPV